MERESSKDCSAFFLWRNESFSSRNRPSRNSTLFSSRRSASVLKCNQGGEVFAEFSGTFSTLWPRQRELHVSPLTVANVHLEKSFRVKYLGVYIDCHFTWHDHIDYICGKISKNINIMVKLKHYVSKATLISVYYSLIYLYLTYACTLWGNNYNAPLSQIVKLQNKAVRVINNVPLMESITPHYTSLGLLKLLILLN